MQTLFNTGNVGFSRVDTVPEDDEFPISTSTALATLLVDGYNTTLSETTASGRLYRNRNLDALDDLPGNNLSYDERYVTMNARVLLFQVGDVLGVAWCVCVMTSRMAPGIGFSALPMRVRLHRFLFDGL